MIQSRSITQSGNGELLCHFRHNSMNSVVKKKPYSLSAFQWLVEPVAVSSRRFLHSSKEPLSEKKHAVPFCASPIAICGVGVVVAGYDGYVKLLSQDLSKVFWKTRSKAPIYASLIADPVSHDIIVTDTKGTVSKLNIRGETVWTIKIGHPIYATPVINKAENSLVIAAFGNCLCFLNLSTGQISKKVELPTPWYGRVASRAASRNPYSSPTRTKSNQIIVNSANSILAFDNKGKKIWEYQSSSEFRASLATCYATNKIFAVGVNGVCLFLDGDNGAEIGRVILGDKVTASPAVSKDNIILGTASGRVVGLSIVNCDEIWSAPFGAPFDHTGFSTLPDGNVISTNERGNIIARNSMNGDFLWESSQALGQSGYGTAMNTTPICGNDGYMYCGSYTGAFYSFVFRPTLKSPC